MSIVVQLLLIYTRKRYYISSYKSISDTNKSINDTNKSINQQEKQEMNYERILIQPSVSSPKNPCARVLSTL
jgi:hypothetical protein